MSKRAPSDRQMDRLERMLERCIAANKPGNRKRLELQDPFYQTLKRIKESEKKWEEEKGKRSGNPEEDPKR
jgi:hypothetical protein